MGIRGLENYVEKIDRKCCYKINMKKEIQKCFVNGTTPKIVVDAYCVFNILIDKSGIKWINGGQLKELYEMFRHFISCFTSLGAEVIAFFDCRMPNNPTNDAWLNTRIRSVNKVRRIIGLISSGIVDSVQVQSRFTLVDCALYIPNVDLVMMHAFLSLGCQIIKTKFECHSALAKYALRNNCLAIISQNSEFIIHEGAEYYWSMKNMDLDRMTTFNYDRIALSRSLGISTKQLPLFATLMGNSTVKYEDTAQFKISLVGCSKDRIIGDRVHFNVCKDFVTAYVKQFPVAPEVFNFLPRIAKDVFSDETKADLLLESLKSYDGPENLVVRTGNDKWDRIIDLALFSYTNTSVPLLVYFVIAQQIYWCGMALEDFESADVPASMEITKMLRQGIYGVLLHEKPLSEERQSGHLVHELIITDDNSLKTSTTYVEAVTPNVPHPGLEALWNEEVSLLSEKWAIISDVIGTDVTKVKDFPTHLIVPTLALSYLLNQELILSSWELKAIISTIVVCRKLTPDFLKTCNPKIISIRALNIQTILSRTYHTIITLLYACGMYSLIKSEDILPVNYHDGNLFHNKYFRSEKGAYILELCENSKDNLEQYVTIYNFLLPN